mmetsp:Transcript_13544/g.31122  ORF Transcript_13544/g.31122 Transcript_13544/m.31122 type:complete len:213 (+) Transcript_13544:306-944(+)
MCPSHETSLPCGTTPNTMPPKRAKRSSESARSPTVLRVHTQFLYAHQEPKHSQQHSPKAAHEHALQQPGLGGGPKTLTTPSVKVYPNRPKTMPEAPQAPRPTHVPKPEKSSAHAAASTKRSVPPVRTTMSTPKSARPTELLPMCARSAWQSHMNGTPSSSPLKLSCGAVDRYSLPIGVRNMIHIATSMAETTAMPARRGCVVNQPHDELIIF